MAQHIADISTLFTEPVPQSLVGKLMEVTLRPGVGFTDKDTHDIEGYFVVEGSRLEPIARAVELNTKVCGYLRDINAGYGNDKLTFARSPAKTAAEYQYVEGQQAFYVDRSAIWSLMSLETNTFYQEIPDVLRRPIAVTATVSSQ